VVELSKKYLYPDIERWLNNKKINIIIGDGNKYVLDLDKNEKIDLVIMDTTSPVNQKSKLINTPRIKNWLCNGIVQEIFKML
jgi:spermidine synthase